MARPIALLLLLACSLPSWAQRDPVLKQVEHPHPYYFREMYLPQLTSGPSAATWSPDGKALIFSMQGSLWRQALDSTEAEQLTDGPGYDYQPDWSPDGRHVVYAKYDQDAVELWLLELESRRTTQLTHGGAVNLEPRWSPDGRRLAFVSTSHNGRFHIFVADFDGTQLQNVQRLTGETRTQLPRYYYSAEDHEISPTWSPDGREIIFVSNHGRIYGTGGLWRMQAQPGAQPREIYYEETTWKARPDWSPDGKKVIYASYLGRPWHQLWTTTPDGGDVFPMTYGEYDNTAPRWSPDGSRVAFISNRDGNTSLWTMDWLGGRQRKLEVKTRRYLKPTARLSLTVLDANDRPTSARVSLVAADGRFYAPDDAWIHADDSFDRSLGKFEPHYFHTSGTSEFTIPAGKLELEVLKGFEHHWERRPVEAAPGQHVRLTVRLRPLRLTAAKERWVSGDMHVHMNYGGAYRNTPERLLAQAAAENLNVVHNQVVNKEQRIPDITYFSAEPDPASTRDRLLFHDQEFHTSHWGHMGLLGMKHYLLPDYVGYPNTASASLYPHNSAVADLAHEQDALVGYVHPFEADPDPLGTTASKAGRPGDPGYQDPVIKHALPVDVALGKVDYLEVMGFADHRATAAVWYRLLNLGFRIPAGAGTDAMANFASLRGPVGLNRVYAVVPPGPLAEKSWLDSLRRGRSFVSNGPLLEFNLAGQGPGGEVKLPAGTHELKFTAGLWSFIPVEKVEVVCNGRVVQELKDTQPGGFAGQASYSGTVPISESGWCLLRAGSEKPQYPILDIYPYATTCPVYITVGDAPPRSPQDARYFVAWVDRVIESAEKHTDWNTPEEKETVMRDLRRARAVYEGKQ